MDQNIQSTEASQIIFQEVIKRAYERGVTEKEITVGKLLEEMKADLRNLLSK